MHPITNNVIIFFKTNIFNKQILCMMIKNLNNKMKVILVNLLYILLEKF
jgi:hypothetical protein